MSDFPYTILNDYVVFDITKTEEMLKGEVKTKSGLVIKRANRPAEEDGDNVQTEAVVVAVGHDVKHISVGDTITVPKLRNAIRQFEGESLPTNKRFAFTEEKFITAVLKS